MRTKKPAVRKVGFIDDVGDSSVYNCHLDSRCVSLGSNVGEHEVSFVRSCVPTTDERHRVSWYLFLKLMVHMVCNITWTPHIFGIPWSLTGHGQSSGWFRQPLYCVGC